MKDFCINDSWKMWRFYNKFALFLSLYYWVLFLQFTGLDRALVSSCGSKSPKIKSLEFLHEIQCNQIPEF